MKTPLDPRHQKREKTVQELFAWSFKKNQSVSNLSGQVVKHLPKIDKLITECAPEWPIEQINKTDLAILRLALFELSINKKEPIKVIIDEAVELAKEFGSESSPPFVNGVLGSALKKI